MKILFRSALLMLAWQMPGFSAHAQQPYPSKPIRMLIPSPPGGGADTLARLLQQGMAELWGQPVVADNRGGASGQIAAAAVAKAAPDGYTLFFTYGGVITTGLPLYGKLPYDPMRDFAPAAMLAHVPGVLVAHPSFPAKSVSEIIKMAKAKPGAMTHGSSSIGSSSHMNMALFKQMAGIDMLQVSYQGDAPSLVALLGGHVPLAFSHVVAALPHIQSGKLRALAVATAMRIPNLPDTPSVAESGLPGYEGILFYALMAPAKTPQAVINKLHEATTQIKQMASVKQRLAAMGAVPFDMPLAGMSPYLQSELDKWTRVVKAGGIKPE
ncbi:MAG: tripartite tricarboxylate transporter substrate-binding protein [Burkholderiales bacterium]